MKKIYWILIISILVCTFVACSVNNSDENTTETNDINATTDVIDNKVDFTVDSIVEFFNEDYNAQQYTSEMISYLIPNFEKNGIALNGNITTVIHFTKKSSTPELTDWSWAYVYEFTEEADAIAFEENRRVFVEATEENGVCVRCGLIVVFGSAPILSSITNN
ncbi:MAG: hypothetical protein IJY39_02960 [Clostridia bacterium]|nr:hypothetical protein [Clostridia bacterium]